MILADDFGQMPRPQPVRERMRRLVFKKRLHRPADMARLACSRKSSWERPQNRRPGGLKDRFRRRAGCGLLEHFVEGGAQGDVDFGLLVCEPDLVPFYERLGWRRFPGELIVTQRQASVPFTFNLPMTTPLRLQESLGGKIDLLGPPW